MVTSAQNRKLTQTGPGTPGGELLRRYWQPLCPSGEITEQNPKKKVRILGEDLVVFRDAQGRLACVEEHCKHRGTSLYYGYIEPEGLRCPYHGWLYDTSGQCVEMPFEPKDSRMKDRMKLKSYPVQRLGGLLFVYMGPDPAKAPLLPRWDVLAREDGKRWTVIDSLLECNWLQPMENSVDPAHLFWLHGDSAHLVGHSPDYGETHDFIRFDYGIIKRRTTPGKKPGEPPLVDEHPLVFPSTLRHVARYKKDGGFRHNLQIRVPVDDTHTQVYRVNFVPSSTERSPADQDPPFERAALKGPDGRFDMTMVAAQDAMAWETQGGVTDRTQENLGASDVGVITLRKLLKEQIDIVRAGGEPMGVVRDPEKNKIIDFDVINERIGLFRSTDKKVA